MRTTTAAEDSVLNSATRSVHVRVRVQNADGTWIDYTNASGYNWLDRLTISANVDQPVPSAQVRLFKYVADGDSLAPLDETSPLNVDDGATYAAALDAGREIDILAATTSIGSAPSGGDYKTLFHGEIDSVDWGSEQAVVRSRDRLMAHLQDRWIEDRTEYGTEAGRPVEDVIQDVLDDWTDGRVTLWVPSSPGFVVTPYLQQEMSVWSALMQLAQLTGWDLRSRWNSTATEFQLKFFEPNRTASTTDWDFSTSDLFAVQALDIDREPIRNAVRVSYTDAGGNRNHVNLSDSASISRFGRRWMGISEPSDSPINTESEATTLGNAALNDLSSPQADQRTEQDFFWPIEVGDYVGYAADDRWYSTQQDLGVYGYQHELSRDRHITSVMVRGKPAGQYLSWRAWERTGGPADGNVILDLREVGRTTTTVTYEWTLGAEVEHVWILRNDATQPVSSDPWPTGEDHLIEVLGRNTTSYTFDLPDPGSAAFVHLEPTDAAGRAGPVRKLILQPLADDPDRITAMVVQIDDSDGSAEVRVGAPDTCQSYRYAYSTGSGITAPSDAAVESGTVRTISTVDSFTLPAATVGDKEWLVVRAAGYTAADGTGPDGTAGDHGPIVEGADKRVTPIGATDIEDGAVTAAKVSRQAQSFSTTVDFSASDYNTVAWTTGDVDFVDGTSYTINSGDTGDMTAATTYWIYFDPTVSTTAAQVTTTRSDITGDDRVLLCTAWPASNTGSEAGFVPAIGILGVTDTNYAQDSISAAAIRAGTITATEIAASTITANEIASNTITASKLNVATLSAIAADVGTLTAGAIQNAASSPTFTINLDATGSSAQISGPDYVINADGTFTLGDSGSENISWNGSSLTMKGQLQATSSDLSHSLRRSLEVASLGGSVHVEAGAAIGASAVITTSGSDSGERRLRIKSAVDGDIDLVPGSGTVELTGALNASGDVVAFSSSDLRMKRHVRPISGALEKLSAIRGVGFEWRDTGRPHLQGADVGVIAQEVRGVVPSAVRERPDGTLGVDYNRLVPLIVEAVNELRRRLE